MKFAVAVLVSSWCCSAAQQHGYVGRDVCASCHKDIAATQAQTRMAQTWQSSSGTVIPAHYNQTHKEGPDPAIGYKVSASGKGFNIETALPGRDPARYATEELMGGTRHGVSFLFRVHELGGTPLTRAPLIEGRYLYSIRSHDLAQSPGFPLDKPANFETALGRVLSPSFESKCLSCHGAPRQIGSRTEVGVTCESCHGSGQQHLLALAKKTDDKGILNPKKLPVSEQMKPCSQCHAGFSVIQDPMPDDLLISDQVTALQNSECWRQTEGQLTCVNCHNPHQDAPRQVLESRLEKTCLTCHNATVVQHAALCPVNRTGGCVGCHMPDAKDRPPFEISDHWIRVHPEQNVPVPNPEPEWRSQRTPRRVFLRLMVFDDAAKAAVVENELSAGASFFDLARANSVDRSSAANGGFLGDVEISVSDAAWSRAAAQLKAGEISKAIDAQGKYFIVQRMPRNFREDAEDHFNAAMRLHKQGDRQGSAAELLTALRIYPRFLRALTYLGITYAESGDPATAAGILNSAARLYPNDAGAHFNLGIAYGATGTGDEIGEYRRALEIDPDLVPVYLNLGAALYNKGQYEDAIQVYRKGIEINPLVASLHYSLGVALQHEGKKQEAETEMALGLKIDPKAADR
jgi:predicted CXXCH cytochrome family protein